MLQNNTGQGKMWNKTVKKPQTVRCNGCGRSIEKDGAYCVIKGPKRLYYCSKEEYEGGKEYIEERNKYEEGTIRAVKDIVCYDQNKEDYSFDMTLYNTLLVKWLQSASSKKIYYYLTYEEEKLKNILIRKNIEKITGRLKYLSAVLISNIADYDIRRPADKPLNQMRTCNDYNAAYKPRLTPRENLRRSLEELEDKYGD